MCSRRDREKSCNLAIDQKTISEFRKEVLLEMGKMGASDADKGLINDEVIATSIRNGHDPKSTAWAIMQ